VDVRVGDEEVQRLRQASERHLEADDSPAAIQLLEALVDCVPDASEHAFFAHRHLGELKLESQPWVAALHLRRCVRWQPGDDSLHALMGLAQALLENYRTAVTSYRRAVRLSPDNPWYRHNLGHLLDVALSRSEEAFEHLEYAHKIEPNHHEITASLAHCLAGMGRMQDAADLAAIAAAMAPENQEHGALAQWIRANTKDTSSSVQSRARATRQPFVLVAESIEKTMRDTGYDEEIIDAALDLWDEYWLKSSALRIRKPGALASAIEFAVVDALCHGAVSQREVASRYSVTVASLRARLRALRAALSEAELPSERQQRGGLS
jgi:tetratricopeptide (TPR) repeat protein